MEVKRFSGHYREIQLFSLLATCTAALANSCGINPDSFQGLALQLCAKRELRHAMADTDIIQLEHPWFFDFVQKRKESGTPVVLSAHNVEGILMSYHHSLLAKSVRPYLEEIERRAVRNADTIIAISDDDARRIREMGASGPVIVAPNGVDLERLRPVEAETRQKRKRELGLDGKCVVIFSGGIHFPNVMAARFLKGLATRHERDNLAFMVIGRAATPSCSTKNFKAVGFVPDVVPYYEAADIAVNPLTAGSGSSLKTLEFLAMGLPTITTSTGARGLGIHDRKEALIRNLSEFSEALGELVSNPTEARRLAVSGRRYVETYHSWKRSAKIVLDAYRNLAT